MTQEKNFLQRLNEAREAVGMTRKQALLIVAALVVLGLVMFGGCSYVVGVITGATLF